MNYRSRILRDLAKLYKKEGTDSYVTADTLPSFHSEKACKVALNQLLREELILVVPSGDDQRAAIVLNPDRLTDIRRETYSLWRDLRFLIPAITGALALVWAILSALL